MKNLKSKTAAMLLAIGLGGNLFNSEYFSPVSTSIEQIKTLSNQRSELNEIFAYVEKLSTEINKINADIVENINKIKKTEFSQLLLTHQAIGFAFHLLKQRSQAEILAHYRQEFRAFSNAKNRLENNLQMIKEKLYGVEIVEVKGLSLTEDEINEMTEALEKRG